ncbi:MarR family winged helix-turn-helix transcriptional regulator [Corynebacterium variabile]|uniref:MarR family winged helix-turn-helix transcriptional regulator n=1 Tax=Corynebacterium variabile TaxID=1727 RepID=UPI003FD34D29
MSDSRDLRSQTVDAWASTIPDIDRQTMETVALIKSISEAVDRASDQACRDLEISAAELELLVPLRHHNGPLTAARLADMLHMSRAGVSKHLRRLEDRGLVVRQASDADRRTAEVTVTDRGRTLTDSTFARDLAAHRALLQDSLADPTTVAVLRRINSAIMGRMDELT